jgi:uncharacterized membrane protein YcaP (DUF421 family)
MRRSHGSDGLGVDIAHDRGGAPVTGLLGIDLPTALAVVIATLGICLTLLVLVRVSGARTLATMSGADVACVIALGAVVGRTTLLAVPTLAAGVIALVVLFGLQRVLTWLERRQRWGRLLSRPPLVLMSRGGIRHDALERARLSHDDLRQCLRLSGVTHRDQVALVVLERTGQISVLCGADPEDWLIMDLADQKSDLHEPRPQA